MSTAPKEEASVEFNHYSKAPPPWRQHEEQQLGHPPSNEPPATNKDLDSLDHPRGPLNDTWKFFLANLPPSVTPIEMRRHFEAYGEVNFVKLIYNKTTGVSMGYGFLYLLDEETDRRVAEYAARNNNRIRFANYSRIYLQRDDKSRARPLRFKSSHDENLSDLSNTNRAPARRLPPPPPPPRGGGNNNLPYHKDRSQERSDRSHSRERFHGQPNVYEQQQQQQQQQGGYNGGRLSREHPGHGHPPDRNAHYLPPDRGGPPGEWAPSSQTHFNPEPNSHYNPVHPNHADGYQADTRYVADPSYRVPDPAYASQPQPNLDGTIYPPVSYQSVQQGGSYHLANSADYESGYSHDLPTQQQQPGGYYPPEDTGYVPPDVGYGYPPPQQNGGQYPQNGYQNYPQEVGGDYGGPVGISASGPGYDQDYGRVENYSVSVPAPQTGAYYEGGEGAYQYPVHRQDVLAGPEYSHAQEGFSRVADSGYNGGNYVGGGGGNPGYNQSYDTTSFQQRQHPSQVQNGPNGFSGTENGHAYSADGGWRGEPDLNGSAQRIGPRSDTVPNSQLSNGQQQARPPQSGFFRGGGHGRGGGAYSNHREQRRHRPY